ncbi:MAG: hypothetical protein Udaeo2_19570 [Candidatus Udaeobacter sp.]|nr:MAG: hypothetical protein Udaeo2_19570 [Candidatus Udaeobacter sp.]
MIIWGGFGPCCSLNSGGRYNPDSDSWTGTSTTNAPSARSIHTAVWTGSEMIIWGGSAGDVGAALDTGGRYDPGTDTWIPTRSSDRPSPRDSHTAVWTGSEVIVWGGFDGTNDINSGGRYDPSTDT